MDLYEALKGGATVEELTAAFQRELENANDRFSREEEATLREELISDAREELADSIVNYLSEIMGDSFDEKNITPTLFIDALKETEKNIESFTNFGNGFSAAFKSSLGEKPTFKFSSKVDDDIIKNFVRGLW